MADGSSSAAPVINPSPAARSRLPLSGGSGTCGLRSDVLEICTGVQDDGLAEMQAHHHRAGRNKIRSNEEFEWGSPRRAHNVLASPHTSSSLAGESPGVQRISGAHKHILLSIKHIS